VSRGRVVVAWLYRCWGWAGTFVGGGLLLLLLPNEIVIKRYPPLRHAPSRAVPRVQACLSCCTFFSSVDFIVQVLLLNRRGVLLITVSILRLSWVNNNVVRILRVRWCVSGWGGDGYHLRVLHFLVRVGQQGVLLLPML
jgi:hypothetical protein